MPISELRQKKWAMLFGLLFLHQAAAYLIVRFCIPYLAFGAAYIPYLNSGAKDWTQLLFAHMLSFSLFPAFAIALLINRTLRHRSAVYVWVVPMVIFAYEFLFSSPTVYPTMVFESDFGSAFRMWIGDGYNSPVNAYYQLTFTAPVYVGAAYSFGAWLALRWPNTQRLSDPPDTP